MGRIRADSNALVTRLTTRARRHGQLARGDGPRGGPLAAYSDPAAGFFGAPVGTTWLGSAAAAFAVCTGSSERAGAFAVGLVAAGLAPAGLGSGFEAAGFGAAGVLDAAGLGAAGFFAGALGAAGFADGVGFFATGFGAAGFLAATFGFPATGGTVAGGGVGFAAGARPEGIGLIARGAGVRVAVADFGAPGAPAFGAPNASGDGDEGGA